MPRLYALIDIVESYLSAITPVCFLDVTTKNVLVIDDELTGVVDLDVVCHGDPGLQIALTAASITAGFPAECAFYVSELVRLANRTEVGMALLSLYEAVFLTQFLLASPFDGDEPWRARAATAANRRLDDVEQSCFS